MWPKLSRSFASEPEKILACYFWTAALSATRATGTKCWRKRDWITVLEQVPNPEIYQILKRSDVFVRAFADESYGISRIEALWCGIPVVATRAGETRGMLLYDFGDVEQLVNQLQAVLLYPVLEETNPWAERYRREAEQNLQAMAKVLGVEQV